MTNQAVTTKNSPTSIGDTIDRLFNLREQKRRLNKQLKDVEDEMAVLERHGLDQLDEAGISLARGERASAGVTETEVPEIEDWDQVIDYCKQEDAFYLFQRRLSSTAWRELKQAGEQVPGTKCYVKRALSLRKR